MLSTLLATPNARYLWELEETDRTFAFKVKVMFDLAPNSPRNTEWILHFFVFKQIAVIQVALPRIKNHFQN